MFTLEDIYNDIKAGASLPRLHKKYGGFKIYIPQRMPDYKERIIEEFTGYNYDELAFKYNTSRSNVEEIIKQNKEEHNGLFD